MFRPSLLLALIATVLLTGCLSYKEVIMHDIVDIALAKMGRGARTVPEE